MDSVTVHRPRNVDWKRAAALLYGDLGTSKAYVLGLAFLAAGYGSLPIILAVCLLTGLVSYNYIIVCRHFPDGGGVYSAARSQSRLLAAVGALLLVANLTVTSAMSAWAATNYFGVPHAHLIWTTIGFIVVMGVLNHFGPKHSGSLAVSLCIPMVLVVLVIIGLSLPYLSVSSFKLPQESLARSWVGFVGVILALSGVESIANMTGVLKLDSQATMDGPSAADTSRKAILIVAVEVVLGTALLGWAMVSLPGSPSIDKDRCNDMLRFLAEQYGGLALGPSFSHWFGVGMGLVVGLLLLSAVNTAMVAMIGLVYIMARDGEMPKSFVRLNPHGVPIMPLIISAALPIVVVTLSSDLESLASLYAIGVVGAITVNLGSCSFDKKLDLTWHERLVMMITFVVLLAVEITIAKTKPDALFFAVCILGIGLGVRAYSQKRAGLKTLTVSQEVAAAVDPETLASFQPSTSAGQAILVAARGLTPVLRFALEEARLRQAILYVLYVRELAVALPAPLTMPEPPRWQNNREASRIMYGMLELGRQSDVTVVPLYAISDNPSSTILDLTATLGIDILLLGASHRRTLVSILKGDVVTEVARNLPENIQLVIYG